MREREMKEELTTAMHSEFFVDAETDEKHKVWSALSDAKNTGQNIEDVIDSFGITMDQVRKWEQSYFDLFK